MNKEIIDKFLNDFKIIKGNKNEPYLILFDAYTGMGKSTISLLLSKYDNSIILNNDEVRRWLENNNYDSKLKDKLQKIRLEQLLQNNNSCILDSCFSHNYKDKLNYYKSLGYKYYIIRLVCNENIIKERLEKRKLDGINYSTANYNDYLWMKNNVTKVDDDLIDFVINTEENIKEQVKLFVNKIL